MKKKHKQEEIHHLMLLLLGIPWFIQENLHAINPIQSFHILIEISGNPVQACCKPVTPLRKKLEIDHLNRSANQN